MSIVKKKEEYLQSVSQLGDTTRINADVFHKIKKLFLHLNGMPDQTNIKETRLHQTRNTPKPHQLPPAKDELTQHIIRASYEVYVWKRVLETNLDIPCSIPYWSWLGELIRLLSELSVV